MQNSAAILENRLFTDSEILKSLSSYNICDQAEENLDNVMAAFNGEQDIAIEESVMRGASHYASPECNDYFHSMNIFNHDKYNLALLINLRILEQLPSDKLGDVFKDSFNLNDNYELTLESTSSKNYPKGSKNYPEGSKGVIKGLFL
ncbi:MAG: hypothetical protein KAQ85_06370, partial [Thermodesulfovibrionia bacterium]|nr:hypothetical protein [Thermodesulfovibrionia bacterium]